MSPLEQLTKRQRAVYEFIRDKIRNRGYGPTVREIGDREAVVDANHPLAGETLEFDLHLVSVGAA